MITANNTLNALDLMFKASEAIEEFDYVAFGDNIIKSVATLAAAIVAVTTYIFTALQLFWCNYGEQILTAAFQFIIHTADFANACYTSGRAFRRALDSFLVRGLDYIYFATVSV